MRPDHRPIDRGHDQHGERMLFETLLLFHVLVARKECLKPLTLDQLEQSAVLDTAPLHADDGMYLMPRQRARQLARHVFIEEHSHGWA